MPKPNQLAPICTAKTLAGMIGACFGAPLVLDSTPGCTCTTCTGINAARAFQESAPKLTAALKSPEGIGNVLSSFAGWRPPALEQPKPQALKLGPDGVYR